MEHPIQSALDYIEHHLKTDITPDELAGQANYSTGHFCRLFAQAMDTTVASYILKRRLDHALQELLQGSKAIDVVMEYGFNTYAGFYKAFVKMYGCSPKKYVHINKKSEVINMKDEKAIRTILENWDLPKGLSITDVSSRHWKTGNIDWQTWAVGEVYYLKTNERSKMIKNIRIAKALAKEGLSSEFLPVPTKTGHDYVDGEHIFLLTKKVGAPLNNHPLPNEELAHMENNAHRMQHAYQLGQAIAKLHRALLSVQDDVKPHQANMYAQGIKAMEQVKAYANKHALAIADSFFEDYTKTFGTLYEALPKQLIHGNPTVESIVYENGAVVGLKGYEIYNISHIRLFDITWCAGEINTHPIGDYLAMLGGIVKGYDHVSPLTPEEKQSIYYVLCTACMNTIAYCGDGLDVSQRNAEALVFLAANKDLFSHI